MPIEFVTTEEVSALLEVKSIELGYLNALCKEAVSAQVESLLSGSTIMELNVYLILFKVSEAITLDILVPTLNLLICCGCDVRVVKASKLEEVGEEYAEFLAASGVLSKAFRKPSNTAEEDLWA